jgi:hypothetical protein
MKLLRLFNTNGSLQSLISLSKEATQSNNPTLYFFQQNARTPFFDLEAACKIFRKTHSEDAVESLLEMYKSAEDALGKYDFILQSGSEILKKTSLSEEIRNKIILQEKKAQIELKQFLLREKWLPDATENASNHLERLKNILETDSSEFRDDFIKFLKNSVLKIAKANLIHIQSKKEFTRCAGSYDGFPSMLRFPADSFKPDPQKKQRRNMKSTSHRK